RDLLLLRPSLHDALPLFHDLFDRALQKSDLAVYDEYIRQAEREVAEFKRTIAPMIAQFKTTSRRREALANKAAELDALVDHFLLDRKSTRLNSRDVKSSY